MNLHFHTYVDHGGRTRYVLDEEIIYWSPRYHKAVGVPVGYDSDGASGPAVDICSTAWWVHDRLCDRAEWSDGSPATEWQIATVLHDILASEGRPVRAVTWRLATFLARVLSRRRHSRP